MKLSSQFLILFVILFNFQFSQATSNGMAGKGFIPAVILLEDGTQKSGELLEFRYFNITNQGPIASIKAFEYKFGLQTTKFTFKPSADSKKTETISIENIKQIHLTDEGSFYEKVKIGTIRSKKNINQQKAYSLLPVYFKNSKLTIYNLFVNYESLFYILKAGEPLAIKIEFTMADELNHANIKEKFSLLFLHIGADCPNYLNWLNNSSMTVKEHVEIQKNMNAQLYELETAYNQEVKNAKKSMKKDAFEAFVQKRKSKFIHDYIETQFQAHEPYVTEFINRCE